MNPAKPSKTHFFPGTFWKKVGFAGFSWVHPGFCWVYFPRLQARILMVFLIEMAFFTTYINIYLFFVDFGLKIRDFGVNLGEITF
jgi:hypothetical protein